MTNCSKLRCTFLKLLPALLVIAVASMAAAQSDAPAPPPPPPAHDVMWMGGPGPGGDMMHDGMGEGKVVKGAPMSGDLVVTRDTTLADGNRIHTENTTKVYRDSSGRVRREIQFELNTPSTGAAKRSMIMISDPVSGNRYLLNPDNKTARQMPMHPGKAHAGHPDGAPGPRQGRPDDANVTREQLGSKAINGLQADGVRVTRTIPAGQIGNDRAIEVVTERWVSTDLQMPLTTTHNDPIMGTVTTKLNNVNRAEPDASLFQVPSDYKIQTGKGEGPFFMPMK